MATGAKKKSKSLSTILEELDRPIYECKWSEVQNGLKKISKKKPVPPAVLSFLKAIEKLENIVTTGTRDVHSQTLGEVEKLLKESLDASSSSEDSNLVQTLIKIKQGQVAWMRDERRLSLSLFPQINSARVDNAPLHTSKVFMECSLYTGLCIETLHSNDKEKYGQAIVAYEECLRLALEITQLSKTSNLNLHPAVFSAIRTVLQRGPLLCMKTENPLRAVGFFRRVLMIKEEFIQTQVRHICVTSITVCLLFLVSARSYSPITFSLNVFSPQQLEEETLLVANIAKSFLGSLEDTKIEDASAIFDILTLAFVDARLPGLLVQTLEESMVFTSAGNHLWLQFALSLVNNKLYQQAEAVFYECVRLSPTDPHVILTASKFVLETCKKPELSIQWLQRRLRSFAGHYLEPALYYTLGEAQATVSDNEITFLKRQQLRKESLVSFEKAASLDPANVQYVFRYSVQLAVSRDVPTAMERVNYALTLSHDHPGCLHLLLLLLTAKKQYSEALKICELALAQDPNNISLLKTKVFLQTIVHGPQTALQSCKKLLKICQSLYSESELLGEGGVADQASLSDFQLKNVEREEVNFTMSPEIASDAGSSHFSISTSPASLNPVALVACQAWCTIAEVFLRSERYSDASRCVHEAQSLAPYIPIVSITNGNVLEAQKQHQLALDQYNNALVLKPYDTTALTCIGRLLHLTGKQGLAEKSLRDSLAVDRQNHETWYWLGKVLSSQGEHETAVDCYKKSLQCEALAPLRRYESVLQSDSML
ncbi:PREDICTED: tetratricopeptide repeat protein 7B-like [Amphimedon queenslandica]|uniref:Tetratricopeptide repeat protein 7 N-terminal domain-containing protein n=1 Tax=Amphimedon queenslandica TaxID=400682 RepID=A0A1X7VQK2_AMPQE|nr:PREDICTED: tetratricopeptide repeat protein 7B-like [Amphimedon queenslandica]|eukprot:XP_011406361.1 PREDICTED: tetratricopeptide repeat protein 7B-like [Amphimedon queenslandica]